MSQQTMLPRFKPFHASAVAIAMVAGFVLATPAFSMPPESMPAEGMDHSKMAGMSMMPHTTAEHSAMAESYKAKAASYREDAEMHRKMLAEYKRGPINNGKTPENPWLKKMRLHCTKYIKDADKLAADADTFAAFHAMRAKEMQGQ